MATNSLNEKNFLIEGPLGPLEARITVAPSWEKHPVGIVCHPHPLFQGTMDNKVVTMVVRAWQALKINSIRFNFRGVGTSAGVFDEGRGEVEDLKAVLQFAREHYPQSPIWLAGFSFGAYIALKMAISDPNIAGLISIAPALKLFDWSSSSFPACPWLIVQGDQDEVTDPSHVLEWYQALLATEERSFRPELVWVPGASHFFHGHLINLQQLLKAFVEKHQLA